MRSGPVWKKPGCSRYAQISSSLTQQIIRWTEAASSHLQVCGYASEMHSSLDEPTAMLGSSWTKSVIETAKKLNKEEGITVILITHYMEEVIEADRIFVMDDGKLVMEGTPKEVFSKVEKLKELRLDVPQATLVAHELQQRGIPLPDGILNNEELVDELCRLKSKM